MAHIAVRSVEDLEPGCILAPERYDPRTNPDILAGGKHNGIRIGQLANLVREMLVPSRVPSNARFLVLDTGDANHGFITIASKESVGITGVGSTKKVLRSGDVIISRLRPYLRQVAWIDPGLTELLGLGTATVVASTEFYVLRPTDTCSLAFLVPFLLSPGVQSILSASQEGGHHPRFPEKTLLNLVVPGEILSQRDTLSSRVELAITTARRSESDLRQTVVAVGDLLSRDSKTVSC